jgi:ubiquinone/menaquinone biosynthesis C-methylase UbiE
MMTLEKRIKDANRRFYDTVGSRYEEIDGRRSNQLSGYVSHRLTSISVTAGGNAVLDLGCGSGFVSIAAEGAFYRRYAMDISINILRAIPDKNLQKSVADSDFLPVRDSKFNCVVAFAVLHHCCSFEKLMSEVFRVLIDGGVFYSDHDLDSQFFNRFKPVLAVYRSLNNNRQRYISAYHGLSEEIYDLSEFHQNGICSKKIEKIMKDVGFKKIRREYHWYGLTTFTDKIFGQRTFPPGVAPLVRITAEK